ncbi:hypothetical protein SAMN06265222_1207 [Neorhodopirellula lusitana]|uniref:Uncharacterized protein n=1 Tax=Neorhodopirellula lusitana TaxID=445327 RepID=A0ABY1QQG6_9BACT|nr:hypothetical protein [Neorhodopirellula lusitana]SMP75777.1 hypothetical protein SAMN06265222_1207 [Neorhodopirellula lusitana]
MRAQAPHRQFSERVLRQVRLDSGRALVRAKFSADHSEIINLRCVDDHSESDREFGNQLWYFEGIGVADSGSRQNIHGVVEYSIQFGLQELVEDGVFDQASERERFRSLYNREVNTPSWRQPAHRFLLAGVMAITALMLLYLLVRNLLA